MKKTTIEVYSDDIETLKAWKQQYRLSMADFIRAWIIAVKEHKQRDMYSRLAMPTDFKKVKPLANVKISQPYRNK